MLLTEIKNANKETTIADVPAFNQVYGKHAGKHYHGDIVLNYTAITSLVGCPSGVTGNFYCVETHITTLKGAPSFVGGAFNCSRTPLTSLIGAPSRVLGNFYCNETSITSLEGMTPAIGGHLICYKTKITSLAGIHKIIKSISDTFACDTVKSNVLGVFYIKGLSTVLFGDPNLDRIINDHLVTQDIHGCQEELIAAGFAEYARL